MDNAKLFTYPKKFKDKKKSQNEIKMNEFMSFCVKMILRL
jgi:hypothetical protein